MNRLRMNGWLALIGSATALALVGCASAPAEKPAPAVKTPSVQELVKRSAANQLPGSTAPAAPGPKASGGAAAPGQPPASATAPGPNSRPAPAVPDPAVTARATVPSEPGRLLPGEDLRGAYRRSTTLMQSGNTAEAAGLLEELAKLNSGDAAVHNALGATYRKQGRLDMAIETYQRAIKARPAFAEAKYNLGIAYRQKGEFARAERAYQDALQANPNFAAAHFNLAVLYDLYLNRPSDALRHYRAFQSMGGQNEMVEIWIADLEKRQKAAAAPPTEAMPAPNPPAPSDPAPAPTQGEALP